MTLFDRLVDDAALFPPGNAPMAEAVAGHRRARTGPDAALVGRFVVAGSRLAELGAELRAGDRFEVAVVLDGPPTTLDRLYDAIDPERASVVAVEARAATPEVIDELAAQRRAGTDLFVETPFDALLLDEIARAGAAAKFRTGGGEAAAFPSEATLAGAIVAAIGAGLTFKCTAGLHHAVRHTDAATGFEHHGFLNVLVATHRARGAESARRVADALAERDAAAVTAEVRAITETDALRKAFAGFGSCSLDEPADDLRLLGFR